MSRTHPLLLLCAGLSLAPTSAALAAPASDTPAVAVVRAFLADRAAGKLDAAYALLSAESRQHVSAKDFTRETPVPAGESLGLPAPLFGLGVLLADTHDTLHYTFTLVGTDPADANTVLVRAEPPAGAVDLPGITLRLMTATDPGAPAPSVDAVGSLDRTTPGAVLLSPAQRRREASRSNLKQLALGIIQYTQDHDEVMPDAGKWVDEIMPYVKTEAAFHDPSAPPGQKWSYAYNRALSHKSLAVLESPATTVMLFESTLGVKNASDTGQSVPAPGGREGGADYAFADGHVKQVPDGTKLSYALTGK